MFGRFSNRNRFDIGNQVLPFQNLQITIGNAKGKQKDDDIYKAKWIDMIKVEFNLDPNKVAILDSNEIFLVVKNTSGTTLYDETSGGGTYEFEGNEIYYSVKQLWKINSNQGLLILSTNRGLLSLSSCKKLKIGGEPVIVVK